MQDDGRTSIQHDIMLHVQAVEGLAQVVDEHMPRLAVGALSEHLLGYGAEARG